MLLRSRLGVILGLMTVVLLALGVHFQQKKQWNPTPDWIPDIAKVTATKAAPNCTDGLPWPDLDIVVDGPVKYARQQIVVRPKKNLNRESVTVVDQPLFPEVREIDWLADSEAKQSGCQDPIVLDVPDFKKREMVDASHALFGISTTLERLEDSIQYLERWIANTGARLFVVAIGPNEKSPNPGKMRDLESTMRNLGIHVTISKPLNKRDVGSQRYFSLTRLMYSNRDEHTKWIALIDDDTFFPSMPSLMSMLEEYDPRKEWYLGGLSEEWWSVARYGLMAFGGAGVFLSISLAEVMDANYDDCRSRSDTGSGDVGVMECVYRHTRTKLTHIPELHQFDLGGDVSGIYESGRLPLSLHHWKRGWWDDRDGPAFPILAMHLISDICGDCFLQRWRFKGDMVLSTGYSIASYPTGALHKFKDGMDLSKVENTWVPIRTVEKSVNRGTDHDVGPDRPMLELEKDKIQYRFLDAVKVEGGVRQFYHHYGLNGELDTILELYWTADQDEPTDAEAEEAVQDPDEGSVVELHSHKFSGKTQQGGPPS